jgi:hypothetical protein
MARMANRGKSNQGDFRLERSDIRFLIGAKIVAIWRSCCLSHWASGFSGCGDAGTAESLATFRHRQIGSSASGPTSDAARPGA